MTEVNKGRPQNEAGRAAKEIKSYDFLDTLGIDYYTIDNEVADTMEVCEKVSEELGATICKNLFLCNRQETDFYLLMIPGNKEFKTKELSNLLGVSRLSFANEQYMSDFLDIQPGSVSVLGLMNDVNHRIQLLIDVDVLKEEYVGIHPCVNTAAIKVSTKNLMEKIVPALKHEAKLIEFPKFELANATLERADEIIAIEAECFPPNIRDQAEDMRKRIELAPELFLIAIDKESGKIAGFLNGIATRERVFRDEFFKDATLHDKSGRQIMLLGLDVLSEYRGQHLATTLVQEYIKRQKAAGKKMLKLTCLNEKINMYEKMGFVDEGISASVLGGEEWHEMSYLL